MEEHNEIVESIQMLNGQLIMLKNSIDYVESNTSYLDNKLDRVIELLEQIVDNQ